MNVDPSVRRRLVAVLRAGPALRLALLFGSAVSVTLRPDSDLDIGILPADPDLALAEELALQAELTRSAERDVDLIRLDTAPTTVKWQVARDGHVLLAGDEFERSRFVAETASDLDFAPALRRAQERFRERLAADGGGEA